MWKMACVAPAQGLLRAMPWRQWQRGGDFSKSHQKLSPILIKIGVKYLQGGITE
jgi:hypothetical protein